MAFCPSVFKLSFWFLFASLLMGAFVGEVDFDDLEANLFFAVFFFWWGRFRWPWDTFFDLLGNLLWCSRFCWLRGINLFLAVCFFGEVDFVDLKTRFCSLFDGCLRWWGRFRWPWGKFIFYSALSSIGSISLTQRHQFFVLSSFRWSRFCWPRGTNFIFAVRFLRWGRFRWPWGTNLFSVLI